MLASVIIPNVELIGSEAFSGCAKLQSMSIPKCTTLGSSCFAYCTALSEVTLSDDLKTIEEEAFYNSGLTAVDIPEGVTTIGSGAFYCPLEIVTLPSTLKDVHADAFNYYKRGSYDSSTGSYEITYVLKDVYCKCVAPIATSAFSSNIALGATLHVPAFSVSAYKLDDNWYRFNKIVAIEGDLTDVTINRPFNIVDYAGLAANANLTLATGGHLTVSGNAPLSLGRFVQSQSLRSDCSTLIANSEIRAGSVTTKISLPTGRWSFLSLPYDVNVSDIVVPEGTMWVVRK